MVHIPKILKVSAGAVKTAALTGVALVQAHPVAAAFTVVAIVGVGLAIYYTKKSKNREKEDDLTYLSHGIMGHSKDAKSYFYDPETKSITTDFPKSNASHEKKGLRKRQVAQSASSTKENNPPDMHQDNEKVNLALVQERSISNNLNTDASNVSPNDILSTGKTLTGEEKVNEYIKNLSETEFTGSANEFHSIETTDKNSIDLSSASNSQSYWIDNSFLDLADLSSESSVGTLLPEQSDWCRACGENPVNTYTEPCNHRYMCGDCAKRIFRLFKRCKVCRGRIEEIVLETS